MSWFTGPWETAASMALGLVIPLGVAAIAATGMPARPAAHPMPPLCSPAAAPNSPDLAAEKPFLNENALVMARMMAGMEVKPTGDIDRDFVAMMRPHHQGAIDMAQAYLRYGKNEQLRRVAQEIIVEQGQEIAAMNLAIGAPLPDSAPVPIGPVPQAVTPDRGGPAHHHNAAGQ